MIMTEKRYNTYCDQNENQTVIDDDLNNTHIFIAYCENLNDAIRLKTALNSVTDELNALHEENQRLSKDKQLAEAELMTYKQRVKDELEMRYWLSNHKPVYEFMAKKLDITLEGNVE